MNQFIQNLLQAKSNPHVFWAVFASILIRAVPNVAFSLLTIWSPSHLGQIAQTQDILEPYIKDAVTALTGYAALAAANSGPTPPPPTYPPTVKP